MKIRLLIVLCTFWGSIANYGATPVIVSSPADDGPGTLREALRQAPQFVEIVTPGPIDLLTELPAIGSVTITGAPTTITYRGTNAPFVVRGAVALAKLAVRNCVVEWEPVITNSGYLSLTECLFDYNISTNGRGGIISSTGTLAITNSRFLGNITRARATTISNPS